MSASVKSLSTMGFGGIAVDIECNLSNNLPVIIIVGFANKAVNEAKERIRGAFANSELELPRKRITINLAPADLPKADSGFDLAIAVSILLAGGLAPAADIERSAFIGELGLEGNTRAVRGIIGKLLAGRKRGIRDFYLPVGNLPQARLVPDVRLFPVLSLRDVYRHLAGLDPINPVNTSHGPPPGSPAIPGTAANSLSAVVGQAQAKLALEIAAAGGHNVFFSGPPGTGKSMLAKALPSILPPLSREEMLEVTHLHSLAGQDYERIVSERPFRSPHHSASFAAVIGGSSLRPGEISLAHRGVLFCDELPEFNRPTLEALRQPLEDRRIMLSRARDSAEYPANFILVATANPCPCGYAGTDGGECNCPASAISRYQQKVSGPILDRLDLFVSVEKVEHDKLLKIDSKAADDASVRERVARARSRQSARFKDPAKLNADMTNADIARLARLKAGAADTLNTAAKNLNLSARTYMRAIKVARTIADLENSDAVTADHVTEALYYRQKPQLSQP